MTKTTGMNNPFTKARQRAPINSLPEQTEQPADEVSAKTKGIMFRVMPADWKRVKDYSTAREKSVQELLEIAFNMLLRSEGLEPIDGIPRDKKSRK